MEAKQKQEKIVLNAVKRAIFGKQVKYLRRDGQIPGNIFGKDFESLAVTMSESDFRKVYNQAGETGVVYVKVDGDEIPTLIKLVQAHPVNDRIQHIDFRKINLRQKIETQVPLAFTGEAPAEKQGAVIMYPVDVVTINALPSNIPSEITIDLSIITEVGQDIRISDLPKSDDYEVIEDPELVIVSSTAHKEESVEPDVTTTIPEDTAATEATGEESADNAGEGEAAPSTEEPSKE